ncbi:MAG: di-heme oxidoredictase family protein [Pseudomonadota bacterium]
MPTPLHTPPGASTTSVSLDVMPGGDATSRKPPGRFAFSQPSATLGLDEKLLFEVGNAFFERLWVSSPASTQASDGLGPLFNARACQSCHVNDGRGHPPTANYPDDNAISMLMRLSIPPQTDEHRAALASGRTGVIPDPVYGVQLQDFALPGHAIEGRFTVDYTEETVVLNGGEEVSLRRPHYALSDLGYGDPHSDLMMSPRIAPPMIGLGLLELIPEADLLVREDPEDRDGDGISGRANRVWSVEYDEVMVGRFGWKSLEPTLVQQSAHAFAGDIGLSSPIASAHWGDCTPQQTTCIDAPHGDSPQYENLEVPNQVLDTVVLYARNLAVPARRKGDPAQLAAGQALFDEAGCAACHTPSHLTGDSEASPHLSRQVIWPYTDLLLHDMGEGLADGRPEGQASGREWRTPPLWGIGLTEAVNGHTYFLHDGRARSLKEAILWHGGEAEASRDAFVALEPDEREALIAFIKTL